MARVLYLGDPHIKISNIDESDRLMHFMIDVSIQKKPDTIVILGDLFDNFAVVRTEILDFWKEWLDTLSNLTRLIVLTGNHDLANSGNDSNRSSALNVFNLMKKKNLSIVDHAQVHGFIGFVPYMHDQNNFLEVANGLKDYGAKILVIHQDIDGGQYENGMYSSGGIDPEKLNFPLIIGGHIHMRQRFGKVILPGTARWLTNSDANEQKGIWLVEHDDNTGLILLEEFIDTSSVCSPIYQITYKEGEPFPAIPNGRVTVELIGSSDWIAKQKQELKGKVSFKTKITDSKKTENRKTGKNLEDFIQNVFVSSKKESMLKIARELKFV